MARQPELRKKIVRGWTYWFTKAGGDTYFGRADEITHQEAKKRFADHLVRIQAENTSSKRGISAGALMDEFLDWMQQHRDVESYKMRRRYCSEFGNFRPKGNGTKIMDLPADKIRGDDLEAWLAEIQQDGKAARTRSHADTSVRHCWNWATQHPSPTPYLPTTFRPFSAVERIVVPFEPLNEADLMTVEEKNAIISAAAFEPNQFRKYGIKKTLEKRDISSLRRTDGQVGCFADVMRCYHRTGARTDELARCLVEDFQKRTKQVTLGKHKRSRTQKLTTVRQLTLNDELFSIFERHCHGRNKTDPVFVNQKGLPWNTHSLDRRFTRVKEMAAALNLGTIREQITIYDFRHLYISDAIMEGIDILAIAKLAGTSVAMIERVYGHFRNDYLHDMQRRIDDGRNNREEKRVRE